MVLDLALVGTGGMLPLPGRWLSSVLLRWDGRLILFDCGEGTQISLRQLGWGLKDIDLILISHLHGDHVGGLPGLLLSQGNSARTEPVDVLGPPGLTEAVRGLRVIAPHLPFEVRCRDLADGETFGFGEMRVASLPAEHAVPCVAYRLDIPRGRRFLPERARALGVPIGLWRALQRGERVEFEGRAVEPEEVLGPPRSGLAVGLVTDTRPLPAFAPFLQGVNLLVCEGTYGSSQDQPKAVERKHMTFAEAATLARACGAERLLLTHFSPALSEPQAYAEEARAIFPSTLVGHDHMTLSLSYPAEEE